jgi:hypothetical protein
MKEVYIHIINTYNYKYYIYFFIFKFNNKKN